MVYRNPIPLSESADAPLYHNPVLLKESVDNLVLNPDGVYADATFGGGGHSREILSRLSSKGRLIAFDKDADAAANAPDDSRFTLIHNDYRFIHNYAILFEEEGLFSEEEKAGAEKRGLFDEEEKAGAGEGEQSTAGGEQLIGETGVEKRGLFGEEDTDSEALQKDDEGAIFDGILADLGVSSHQFDTAGRGFSFRYDAPLDMRMNTSAELTAADIANSYTQEKLEKMLRTYGEVENARKAAELIASNRKIRPIATTEDLDEVLKPITPSAAPHKYLAKVYQAFRIEVNHELRSLERFLEGALRSLKPGGRLVVITYHSLEDRMVKNFMRSGHISGEADRDLIYGGSTSQLEPVFRKPLVPSEEEISSNTRARSAKLRVAQKKGAGQEKEHRREQGRKQEKEHR